MTQVGRRAPGVSLHRKCRPPVLSVRPLSETGGSGVALVSLGSCAWAWHEGRFASSPADVKGPPGRRGPAEGRGAAGASPTAFCIKGGATESGLPAEAGAVVGMEEGTGGRSTPTMSTRSTRFTSLAAVPSTGAEGGSSG